MNGFDIVPIGKSTRNVRLSVRRARANPPYWDLAKQYVLADHMFQTQGSGSFTAHQDLIRGGTEHQRRHRASSTFPAPQPGDATHRPGTVTSLITDVERVPALSGTVSVPDVSHAARHARCKGLSWRYYAPAVGQSFGGNLWNAFDAIAAVRTARSGRRISVAGDESLHRYRRDTLPAVSWVIPDFANSDHPGDTRYGPVVGRASRQRDRREPAWKTTAIVIVWDDWGGWYDHVAPPGERELRRTGLSRTVHRGFAVRQSGLRLAHAVRVRQHHAFRRRQLGSRRAGYDRRSTLPSFLDDFFDFTQQPRAFVPIRAQYSQSVLLQQPPSNKPVDDE